MARKASTYIKVGGAFVMVTMVYHLFTISTYGMRFQNYIGFLPILATAPALVAGSRNFRIVSHNIRYDQNPPRFPGEHVWAERLPGNVKELSMFTRFIDNAFICLQECYHNQLVDLISGLNMGAKFQEVRTFNKNGTRVDDLGRLEFDRKLDGEMPYDASQEWSYIGVGRDDGIIQGEYSPLFYRPAVWRLDTWHSMWMSDTPQEPSLSFGTGHNRILTQGVFTLRSNPSVRVAVLSTHLDDNYYDENDVPRFKSTELLKGVFDYYIGRSAHSNYSIPVALGGDFNGNRTDPAIENMRNGTNNADLGEQVAEISKSLMWGEDRTYTAFGGEYRQDNIDFVWASPWSNNGGKVVHGRPRGYQYGNTRQYWRPVGYGVSPTQFKDSGNIQDSDHRLIFADMILDGPGAYS